MFNYAHIKRSLAAAMAIGVAAFPVGARADMLASASAGGQPSAAASAPAYQHGASTQTGFDWADAGIGAGGAIVLLGTGALSAAGMRRRRFVRAA